jgi:hypothetical protein
MRLHPPDFLFVITSFSARTVIADILFRPLINLPSETLVKYLGNKIDVE